MIDATVNMMVRNGEDCIKQSLESVLPYVKSAVVMMDSRSTDKTKEIVEGMLGNYQHLRFFTYQVKDPLTELVEIRNALLSSVEGKFGWIVDCDEIYPKNVMEGVAKVLARQNGVLAYGFTSWAVWNKTQAHAQSSKRPTMRIFRNFPGLRWTGVFGKEKLKLGEIDLCYDYIGLPFKYIHLTHLKSDNWRKEFGMERVADGRALVELPEDIKIIVKDYVEKKGL